jgi:hypothetical protein
VSDLVAALNSLGRCMAFDPRDWALDRRDAWLWGVIVGWDPDEPGETDGAMAEVAAKHGWTDEHVARLRTLHAAVAEVLRAEQPKDGAP